MQNPKFMLKAPVIGLSLP